MPVDLALERLRKVLAEGWWRVDWDTTALAPPERDVRWPIG